MKLRAYQQDALDGLYRWFHEFSDGNPMIEMPTGSGKSLVIAGLIDDAVGKWNERVLVLTHVKELIEQNSNTFIRYTNNKYDTGIYSAGLSRRDTQSTVMFAGIQSVSKRVDELGRFGLIIIDECHLCPKKGQGRYRSFINATKKVYPDIRIVGFTATPYRLDGGHLCKGEGKIFDDIAYSVTLERMIDENYLVKLVSRSVDAMIDTSKIRISAGEFNQRDLDNVTSEPGLVADQVEEIHRHAKNMDRKSWLMFCSSVKQAGNVVDALNRIGIDNKLIVGSTPKDERATIIEQFKQGQLTCLVNVKVLTTGFDCPRLDLLALLNPTESPALYVQIMGRGMRKFEGKTDCLVLDFGGNIWRHGPVNAVRPKIPGKRSGSGDAPVKVCPECDTIVHAACAICDFCKHVFAVRETTLATKPSKLAPYDPTANQPRWLDVHQVLYRLHLKHNGKNSLRVDYICGVNVFSEWVCIEHTGYPHEKAVKWWNIRDVANVGIPCTVSESLKFTNSLAKPVAVMVKPDGKYKKIVGYKMEDKT